MSKGRTARLPQRAKQNSPRPTPSGRLVWVMKGFVIALELDLSPENEKEWGGVGW